MVRYALLAILLAGVAAAADHQLLQKNWAIQSSADVHESGAVISAAGFSTRGWYPVTVPSTVFGALVENHVYPDPYFGMNLRSVAGVTYPIGANFSNTADAARQPVPPVVVVSHQIRPAGRDIAARSSGSASTA